MSRDLSVYLREWPDVAAAARSVGLVIDGDAILRLDGEYVADVGGPEPVETGDVPTQVEPADVPELDVAACRWSVSVVVQGSAPAGVERAEAFARALAVGTGIVEDAATGLWSAGMLHTPTSSGDRLVDVVQLRWYARRADAPADLAQRWLDLCRAHLPAALPRRFGDSEPPRNRFDEEGDAGFVAAHDAALREGGALLYRATRPCFEGSLAGSGRGRVAVHAMTLDRDVDPVALRALFVGVAGAAAAFWASASVQRGHTWTGRSLYVTGERDEYLAPGGSWLGLPARPVAWSWSGPAYRKLLPFDGPLHAWSDDLLDRDALPATWLPEALTSDGRDAPAPKVPRGLRATTWDALRGRG
ncbi:hypothetical protein [Pseudonocardia abyssalis]|uniref:Uncharacterized protein n=1 Tax=Pseudonocardia abyssalis TaxID=2792008 RepID=A0ABS6V015_9PSEU|nr:hypothetical protein [Pseudonocardia abyssalis]MBW0116024.1 hypothetical protein [Pseudonocardia abyssalis]MBW0137458.1 hypothetical protein [Pseudonocardia abyssalis]